MTVYDLDEIAGELDPVEFKIGKESFTAVGDPTEQVWESLHQLTQLADDASPVESAAAVRAFLVPAFGEDQAARLMEVCGLIRLAALAGTLATHYTEKAGKAQGSNRASKRTGVPSKRTSNGSTKSTSVKRSSAGTKNGSGTRVSHVS